MKTITVDGKEYKLEFDFAAAEVGELVQISIILISTRVYNGEKKQNI